MKAKLFFCVVLTLVLCLVEVGYGAPLQISQHREKRNVFGNFSSDKLITFMQTFGYLEEPVIGNEGFTAEFLYAEDAVVNGIRKIQKFGGLAETGVLNDETIKLFSAPRCGVKDVTNESERRKRYILGSKNWKKRQITYFIANWSPKVKEEDMVKWVKMAFNAWALYSRLKFKQVFDSSADIIIAFGSQYHGDRYPFDGPGNILAHAFYPYEENAFGGDIHFDNDENWKENATSMDQGVDFLTVMTHELGHSLGLAHSPVFSSLMFPYYKGATPAQLDYDDILAMYTMYITRPLTEEPTHDTQTDGPTDPVDFTTTSSTISHSEVPEVDTSTDDSVPDLCSGNFDAVTHLMGHIYVFKGSYIWQFNSKFELDDEYPVKISRVFPNLPKRFTKIDAVYQLPNEDEIVFFAGSEYITYDMRGPIYMSYNITRYTYDPDIEKIDAAMVWSKNNKTYLYSADRFWKYSEGHMMEPFYPRVMVRWNGVPEDLDAAISIRKGPTMFFKGSEYWIYDDKNIRPKKGFPKPVKDLLDVCRDD